MRSYIWFYYYILAFFPAAFVATATTSESTWDFRSRATEEDKITGEAPGSQFGSVVVTTDLIVAVGSPTYLRDAGTTGAVFVYHRASKEAHEWTEEEFIVADDGEDGDLFGGALAVSGGIMIVGAMHNSAVQSRSGAVYTYQRYAERSYKDGSWSTGWDLVAKLAPETLLAQDYFGCSVAIHRNTTVIGAYGRDDGGTFSGAVFIYTAYLDEDGYLQFEFDERILSEDPARYDWFGTSVAVHGDYIIVGAPGVDYNGNPRSGAAYVFNRIASKDAEDGYMWVEMEKLIVSDGAAEDRFGGAVAISGTAAVVGAEGSSHGHTEQAGAAFVFTLDVYRNLWKFTETLSAPEDTHVALTGFGHAVSIYKSSVVVSAFNTHGNGAVFGFSRVMPEKGKYLWVSTFSRVPIDSYAGDGFGNSVSIFDSAIVVGSPSTTYGYIYSYISNATVNGLSFVKIEQESSPVEEFSLPTSAKILLAISGFIFVGFTIVRYSDSIKSAAGSLFGRSSYSSERGSLVSFDDSDFESEHSNRSSIGLTEVEQHRFSSRNPLNNRF